MSARNRLVIFLAMFCLSAAPLRGQQTPEELLQSALYKLQLEGDLRGAIDIFRALVDDFPKHRAVAARALVQLGLAHETLGSTEAERAYQRVLRDYPDQVAAADQARARLATLRPQFTAAADGWVDRRRWVTANDWVFSGSVSPDGHSIAFVDWGGISGAGHNAFGELMVHDTRTAEYRLIVPTSETNGYVQRGIWSRDGQRLAFSTWGPDHQFLHAVNADGSGHRVVTDNPQHAAIWPGAWSASGDFIVSFIRGWDYVRRIGLVSVDDGSVRILKTLQAPVRGGGGGLQMNLSLSPDDRYVAYSYPDVSGDGGNLFVLAVDGSGEERIAPNAARDAYPHWTPDGDRIVFVSDRSGRTGLWAVEVVNGRAVHPPELIRSDVGSIALMGFTEEGSLSYQRFVSESDIHVAEVDWELGDFAGEAVPLSDRFVGTNGRATWSPDGSRIAYLSRRAGSGMQDAFFLVVKSLQDGAERDIELTMRLHRDTRPEWSADGRYVLFSARSTGAYRIDVETGEVTRERFRRDWAGHWREQRGRFVSARQSERLRSMGIRIVGQRDHRRYRTGDEPLRAGEKLLWVRDGIRWIRSLDCEGVARRPRSECSVYDWIPGDHGMMVEWEVDEGEFGGWELSPDATMLAYVQAPDPDSFPNVLWVWPLTGGEPREVARTEGEGAWIPAVRWTPDGRHLLFVTIENREVRDFKLSRVALNGGQPEPIDLPIDLMQLGELTFMSGGTRIAFPVASQGREIWTLSGFPWDDGAR